PETAGSPSLSPHSSAGTLRAARSGARWPPAFTTLGKRVSKWQTGDRGMAYILSRRLRPDWPPLPGLADRDPGRSRSAIRLSKRERGVSKSEIRVLRPEIRGLRLGDTGAQGSRYGSPGQRHGGADSETRGRRLRDTGAQS